MYSIVKKLYIFKTLPRADKIAADHKVSPARAGKYSIAPHLFPKTFCSGSNIVTYRALLIFLAKKHPPKNKIH